MTAMIAVRHLCGHCRFRWITFTSRRCPDEACPFCGVSVALLGVWTAE